MFQREFVWEDDQIMSLFDSSIGVPGGLAPLVNQRRLVQRRYGRYSLTLVGLLQSPLAPLARAPWRNVQGSLFLLVGDIHATADASFQNRADKILEDINKLWQRIEPLFGDDERVGLLNPEVT